MNELDATTSSSDAIIVLFGLLVVAAGALRVLSDANPLTRVLGALTLMFGVATAVIGWRGRGLNAQQPTRRSALMLIGVGLMSLSGTPKALSDPNQAGRGFGAFGVIIGVVGLVAGGLVLGSPRGADLDAPDLWQVR